MSSNQDTNKPAADSKDEAKAPSHEDQPTKIPGVVQVPLMRVHGLGHGPRVDPRRGPGHPTKFDPGHGPVQQQLHDEEGHELHSVTHEPLSARAPEDKGIESKKEL